MWGAATVGIPVETRARNKEWHALYMPSCVAGTEFVLKSLPPYRYSYLLFICMNE